ncbi:MAG TPA: TSUP family transporter [candidate division Zixibacteria bacterium]|jgi:uncharacterized membrane protein YfcA
MEIAALAVLTLIASVVGTLTGFGTSTIMVPAMVLFLPLPETLLMVGVVHWFGDIWRVVLFRAGLQWRLIVLFGIPGIVTSYIGARAALSIPSGNVLRILGIALALYAAFLL